MSKRHFLITSAGMLVLSAFNPSRARAQNEPKPGKDYRLINPVQRTQVPKGKIELIEFMWVGCQHCRRLEPIMEQWEKTMPDDVVFRKVHVNFRTPSHQQLFYTLKAMDKEHELLGAVFAEIHDKRNRLGDADAVFDWAQSQGLDRAEFIKVYKSFGVKTAMRKASQEVAGVGLQSVPTLVVNGKYLTAPSMAGSNQAALKVVDHLIGLARKEA